MVSGFRDSVGSAFMGARVKCWKRERDDEVEREKSEMGDGGCEGFLGSLREFEGFRVSGRKKEGERRKGGL